MPLARWSTESSELGERIQFRLRGGSTAAPRVLLWEHGGRQLLLHLATLRVSIKEGWLLVDLGVETEPTGRRVLQFVFFLGADGRGEGTSAGGTIHTDSREGAQLAQLWGAELRRAIWDGVLDIIEGSISHAERGAGRERLTVVGFSCSDDQLHVDILSGDRI
jgi:hypothetical protein